MVARHIHYAISGNAKGSWLVFLHGLLGSSLNWMKIAPAFEDRYHVLAIDQRGHGKSFKPQTGYGPADFVGDIKGVFDDLGIGQGFLVGHSMGGRNALYFTNRYPKRVRKLVIEDIGPEPSEGNSRKLVDILSAVPVPFATKLLAKTYLLNDLGDPQLGNLFYNHMKVTADGSATWDFPLEGILEIIERGRAPSQWEEIKSLTCPTLVLRGQNSDELTEAEFQKMRQIQPLISGVEIAGAGHWIHFDQPASFIKAVGAFLDSQP